MSDQLYSVFEVEIAMPHKRTLMATGLTEENAEAYVKMAVIRRGVETSFYIARPMGALQPQGSDR